MSATYLPHRVAPMRLARDGVRMAGEIPAERLPRFCEAVEAVAGAVRVQLEFGLDEERRICVRGRLQARVTLVCQRCLGQLQTDLDCPLNLALVHGEAELAGLPGCYEGVVVEREPVELAGLLEDDLILALPNIPQHAADACQAPLPQDDGAAGKSDRSSPFAALRTLKDKR